MYGVQGPQPDHVCVAELFTACAKSGPEQHCAEVQGAVLLGCRDRSQPIWVSLSQGRAELYREILQVEYGSSAYLEK